MVQLNFTSYTFKTLQSGSKTKIFDDIRMKYVTLTPEEWVRQHMTAYLRTDRQYPKTLMAVETPVNVNGLKQRADIVIYNRKGNPVMIVECKSPNVSINNQVFDQAARYNMNLKVEYLVLTNGLNHYCAQLNYDERTYRFLPDIPEFNLL